MFGVVISPVHFVGGFFCYSNFIFFYIDNKEKINSIPRSSLFESLLELHQIFLIFIRSCSRRSEKASVLLKNSSW